MRKTTLPVTEIFRSIQGEGANAGRMAVFVRLSGCNLKCPFCDTDHSAKLGNMEIKNIVEEIDSIFVPGDILVITGGEPTIHKKLIDLMDEICSNVNVDEVAMETNGTNPNMIDELLMNELISWVTVSPKANDTSKEVLRSIKMSDEVKIVLDNTAKPKLYEDVLRLHFIKSTAYIQPCSGNYAPAIEFIKKNPKWRISVQMHKILNVE